MAQSATILVVDDEEAHAAAMAECLERVGHECVIATSGAEALKKLEERPFDIVVTDLRMPDVDGMKILEAVRKDQPGTEVIIVTAYADVPSAVKAMKKGAFYYLRKPVDLPELRELVKRVVEKQELQRDNIRLRQQLDDKFGFEGIIGNTHAMQHIFRTLRQIAPTSATVLITGESGTGKELIAKAIHNNSPRKNHPFVALNCAALSEGILESELFGHEKGAFTGAEYTRKGRFEYANKGTLFLDEVGDMPISTQIKLLRVIENREIMRVGSNVPIKVDVRLIAATHQNLEELVKEGKFREDLYFRLKVVTIHLPPLRERKEDIPLMVQAFIEEFSKLHGKNVRGIDPKALNILCRYNWPGNVRELKNTIESMVVISEKEILGVEDIPEHIRTGAVEAKAPFLTPGMSLEEAEKELIRRTLEMTNGNREETARLLKIGERTLYRKLDKYGLR